MCFSSLMSYENYDSLNPSPNNIVYEAFKDRSYPTRDISLNILQRLESEDNWPCSPNEAQAKQTSQ